jgi:hypothetical protein
MYDTGQAQVTNWDEAAALLATWREQLPSITTPLAYAEAFSLKAALEEAMRKFEQVKAYERIAQSL